MSLLNFLRPKRSPEEQRESIKARQDYFNDLKTFYMNIKAASANNLILPETATQLYKLVTEAQAWLKKNRDADAVDVVTNRLDFATNFQQIMETEQPRKLLLAWLASVASFTKNLYLAKKIDEAKNNDIQSLVQIINEWYKKNAFTASPSEFEQQVNDATSQIETLLGTEFNKEFQIIFNANVISMNKNPNQIRAELDKNNLVALPQTPLQKKEAEVRVEIQKKADEEAKPVDPFDQVLSIALQTFLILLLVLLVIGSGSLSANLAIGYPRPYRFLFFIYGLIPIYAPFVLIYCLYRRIRYGPIPFYAILPMSVEPATSRLGKLFWFPFYWIPDGASIAAKEAFEKSLLV